MAGRPTDYTPEIAEEICTWIASGKSLRSYCRQEDKHHVATVCRWIVSHDEFREQYALAREAGGYAHGDGIIEIVELVQDGNLEPQQAKVMMDGLKWAAERMAPKSHSPRQELTGAGGNPIETKSSIDTSKLSTDALKELMAARASSESDQ